MSQRILANNELLDSTILLEASSEEPLMPVDFVIDPVKTKTWRSLTGWTIVTGYNDRIDWVRGVAGPFVATLTPGNYATGALLAAEIEAQMEAADVGGSGYTVSYSSSTFKFTITKNSSLNIILKWQSGANLDRSVGIDLGYDQDTSSSPTQVAPNISYQSRHYIKVHRSDLARIPVTALAIVNHNIPSDLIIVSDTELLTINLWANDEDTWSPDDATIAKTQFSLSDNGEVLDPAVQYTTFITPTEEEGFIYYRLEVLAMKNPDGYTEIGFLYFGDYLQPTVKLEAVGLVNEPDDFSTLTLAIDGTHYVDKRRNRGKWGLMWKVAGPTDTANLREIFSDIAIGENFILQLIHTDRSSAKYGYFPARPKENYLSSVLVAFSLTFCEAL